MQKSYDILQKHESNLNNLVQDIYLDKVERFKQASDDLYSKIHQFETKRNLDRQMNKKYKKAVKDFKNKQSYTTKRYKDEYEKLDYWNNLYNPLYGKF